MEASLPLGWHLDSLRCTSIGSITSLSSDRWLAVATGPGGERLDSEGASPDQLSTSWPASSASAEARSVASKQRGSKVQPAGGRALGEARGPGARRLSYPKLYPSTVGFRGYPWTPMDSLHAQTRRPGVAAREWGSGGRWFESSRPDHCSDHDVSADSRHDARATARKYKPSALPGKDGTDGARPGRTAPACALLRSRACPRPFALRGHPPRQSSAAAHRSV
jgi:hypothetical protein